jgi:hypothetical protein
MPKPGISDSGGYVTDLTGLRCGLPVRRLRGSANRWPCWDARHWEDLGGGLRDDLTWSSTGPDAVAGQSGGNHYVEPELAVEAIMLGTARAAYGEAGVPEHTAGRARGAEITQDGALPRGTLRDHLSSDAAELSPEKGHTAVRVARRCGWL